MEISWITYENFQTAFVVEAKNLHTYTLLI